MKEQGGTPSFETIAEQFPRDACRRLLVCAAGLTLVAISVRAPLLGTAHTAPDTHQYLEVARQVFHGGIPDNLRPPGYSLLLAIFEALGANPVTAIVVLQNLIGIVLPAGILCAGWRFFNPATGLIAGFLAAASPLLTITEQLALADYLFGVALLVGTVLLAEAVLRVRAGRIGWPLLVATGAAFAVATLFRANGLLALAAIPVAMLVGARAWRIALRTSAIAIGSMLLVLAPWSLYSLFRFDDPTIATEGGLSLYARAVTWDAVPPPATSADGRLALSIYNTAEPGPPGEPRSGLPSTALYNALQAEGKTPAEASSVMGGLAKRAIFEHPGIYLENTWNILGRYRSLYDPHAFGAEPRRDQIASVRHYFQYLNLPEGREFTPQELAGRPLPGDSWLTRVPWQAAQALTRLLFLATLGGLLILLLPFLGRERQRLAGGVILGVLLLGVVGGSLTAVFSQRYDLMFAPFVWLLASATLLLIVRLLRPIWAPLGRTGRLAGNRLPAAASLAVTRSAREASRVGQRLVGGGRRLVGSGLSAAGRLSPSMPGAVLGSGAFEYRATGLGLVLAAFFAPFSATHLAGPLTLGRVVAVGFAALLASDLALRRPSRLRLDGPALALVVAYIGLSAWILLSSRTVGCNCDGKAGGFFEFAFIGLLSLVAIGYEPRLRRPALAAMLCGLLLASALALGGVGSINSGTIDLTQTGGRLSGTYGNANELGFAVALGIPILLAFRSGKTWVERIAFGGALAILGAALVLTYSRGAVIAAAAGILALALWEVWGSRRQVLAVLGAAAACALVGAALYSSFEQERENVSFESVSPALKPLEQRDLSGWDSRPLGPIPHGPSRLANRTTAIAVRSDRAGEGASFRWGEARRDESYTLRFRARSDAGPLPFSFAIGDGGQPANRRLASGELSTSWASFSLPWRPAMQAPHATLYLWQRGGASTFSVADVRVLAGSGGTEQRLIAIPGQLRGSIYSHLTLAASREERRYLHSRLDAAHLALDAFAENPLLGIGWATFPTYSAEHLHYGQLAAHDQYVSIAAELGILGVLLLGLLIAGMAVGAARAPDDRSSAAAIGVLVAALAGMVFVEALPVPQLSIPLALAAAVLAGPRLRARG